VPRLPAAAAPLEQDSAAPAPETPQERKRPIARLSGAIRWPARLDFDNIAVTLTCQSAEERAEAKLFTGMVFAEGRYAVHATSGLCGLVASAPGVVPARVEGLRLAVSEGAELSGPVLELGEGLAVEGEVVDSRGPVAGASVLLEGEGYRRRVSTGARGGFHISGLTPGSYLLSAHGPGGGARRGVEAGARGVRLVLSSRTVRGQVLAPGGVPAADAQLSFWLHAPALCGLEFYPETSPMALRDCPATPLSSHPLLTDAQGRFELSVPADATLLVQASRDESLATRLIGPRDSGGAELLLEEPRRVRLKVRAAEGQPGCTARPCELSLGPAASLLQRMVPLQLIPVSAGEEPELSLRADLPMELGVPEGLEVEAREPLPPTLTVRPRRGR
jgi:hypothetical protein